MQTTVRTSERSWATLGVLVTSQLMLMIDGTIVNIALPRIGAELHMSRTDLSWVINTYILAFGGLLVLGGRAGDILGRRRVFVAGIALFTLASLVGGLAPTAGILLAARVAQGVGAALSGPGTLALITGNFVEGEPRNRALAVLTAVASGGSAIGLTLGGVLTDSASWRWVMFINVPIGVAVMLLTPRFVRESERHPGRFDLPGALTSTLGMTSLVYGLIRVSSAGWSDGQALSAFAAGVVLLAVFGWVETRAEQPVMPLRLLADPGRLGAYVNMLLVPAAGISMFFFMGQYLEDVLGYGSLATGLAFLPLAGALLVASQLAPRLLNRYSPKAVALGGLAVITVGLAWLTQVDTGTSYVSGVLGPMFLFGLGAGFTFMPLTSIILSGVAPSEAGAASGLMQAFQQTGGSLGLAILVTVFGSVTAHTTLRGTAALAQGISAAVTATAVFTAVAMVITLAVRQRRT